jgi:hypothetical protein
MDYRKEAWKTSRPKFTEENLHFDRIEEMDLSLNSMKVYTFEMRSSVIMRDLIFSLRPMEGWALSTRSMPINTDTVCLSSEYEKSHDDYSRIVHMFDMIKEGVPRDKVREVLPLSVSTTYTFTLDHRVLIGLLKTLHKHQFMLWIEYGIPLMVEAGMDMDDLERSTVGTFLEYYKIDDKEKINGISKTGNMIHGHYKMKMALASQFLRQHYSKIKIALWNTEFKVRDFNLCQADMIDIVFYIDDNSYSRLMAMRAHWVIDWSMDMWGGIVGDYVKDMTTKEFWEFIPNGNGKTDPYWADVYNRVLREDPGMPCPIMCEWPAMLDIKLEEVGDSILLQKYRDLVTEGYIIDNPENEHRKKYIELGGEA